MELPVSEAAKIVGVTRQAIQAAIKKGTISATKDAKGIWRINPAELFRVYPPAKQDVAPGLQDFTPVGANKDAEIGDLTAKLKAAHELLEVLRNQNADLKEQRDAWQIEAQDWKQKALPAPEPKRGFLARLFRL